MKPPLYHKAQALESAEFGRSISSTIESAILTNSPKDHAEIGSLALRIKLCNSEENIWFGEDLHTPDGECYSAHGRFWACGSRLCPSCCSAQSRRARRELRKIVAGQKLLLGQHYKFLTLTMPNKGIGLLASREVINKAWSIFRKKKWFTEHILGCFKSEEFTVTKIGVHYHIHLFAHTKYIDYKLFRRCWTESLHSAIRDSDLEFQFNTSDQLAMANCRHVVSVESAIKEVAKYITKSDSWSKIPTSQLIEIARIRRFPRMTEFCGTFRINNEIEDEPIEEQDTQETILDTKSLSDGEKLRSWRDEVQKIGAWQYSKLLLHQFEQCREFRRFQLRKHYPYARFWMVSVAKVRFGDEVLNRFRDFFVAYETSKEGQIKTVERIAQFANPA